MAPDGTTVINPDRLSPETRTHFERMGLIPQPPHEAEATQLHAEATAAYAPAAQGAAVSGSDAARLSAVSFPAQYSPALPAGAAMRRPGRRLSPVRAQPGDGGDDLDSAEVGQISSPPGPCNGPAATTNSGESLQLTRP